MVAIRNIALSVLCALLPAQTVKVRLAGGAITRMQMEDYVGWVLAGEAGGMTSPEALKAMAVAARTYARYNMNRHRLEGFNFCETTHCQDARPGSITPKLRAAVEATEGMILWSRGRPAQIFYTGHCGGRTAAAGEMWPGAARSYLKGGEDSYCLAVKGSWTASIQWEKLAAILGLPGLNEMEVIRRTASGRAITIRSNQGLISAERLHLLVGRSMGWNLLRSRLYEITNSGTAAVFHGEGTGHGVGLCQIGAEERGKAGQKFDEILNAYFPGLHAGVSAKDIPWQVMRGEIVDVWGTAAPVDEELPALADRALAEAEQKTGLRVGKRPQVRAYPSVSIFRDATGEAGTVAAVARGRVVHMQPAAMLRGTGTLRATLLHEMIHVAVLANAKKPLPLWFEEGLADHLGGGGTHPEERRRVEGLIRQRGLPDVMSMLETGVR